MAGRVPERRWSTTRAVGEAGARPRTASVIEFWSVLHEVGAGGDLLDRLGQPGNNKTCAGGWGRGGARAPWRTRSMSSAVSTTSRMRMRPPHLRQRVTSTANTRARSLAQPMLGRPRRGFGVVVGLVVRGGREAERELLPGRRGRGWNDAGAKMMAICEHTEVSRHVKARRRHEGGQPGYELVGAHVGMGGAAAPGGLEVDAHATIGERLDGARGRRVGATCSGRPSRAACGPGPSTVVAA